MGVTVINGRDILILFVQHGSMEMKVNDKRRKDNALTV